MIRNVKYSILALPLVFALSACGSPQAQQEEQTEASTLDQPGFEDRSATSSEAQSEALTLAQRLASDNLDRAQAAVALEDLDRLINDNIVEFPEEMRAGLTEDVQSARSALESDDMGGMQDAASSIQNRLSTAS